MANTMQHDTTYMLQHSDMGITAKQAAPFEAARADE